MASYNLLAYGGTGLGYGRWVGYSFKADTSNTAKVTASDDDDILNDWSRGNYNGTTTPGAYNGDKTSIAESSDIPWLKDGDQITSGVWYELKYKDPDTGETETLDAFLIWNDSSNSWGGHSNSYVLTTKPLEDGVKYKVTNVQNNAGVPWKVLICFAKGTRIRTPLGEVPVENLSVGDHVLTQDNGAQPIRWINKTTVPALGDHAPVAFAPGAIGNARRLVVSPNHRMLVRSVGAELMFGMLEVLVPAKALVNGDTVRRVEGEAVTYVHFLCDRHEIIFAEGAPSESFHPGRYSLGGLDQATREEVFDLFPELREHPDDFPASRPLLRSREARMLAAI